MHRLAEPGRRGFSTPALGLAALSGAMLLAGCTSGPGTPAHEDSPGTDPAPARSSAGPGAPSAVSSTPASTATSRARTPVPPPTPGNIDQTVPSRPVTTRSPVHAGQPAAFGRGVSVTAASFAAVQATARGPGEVGGPAVVVTLRFVNRGSTSVSLADTVVNLVDDHGDPAAAITGSPSRPVTGTLASGRSAVGRYTFTVARDRRSPVTVSVTYSPTAPTVQITADVR